MNAIYRPKPPASEYADLALNLYNGCTHGCKYCYATKPRWVSKEEYFKEANPKKNIIEKIKKDAEVLSSEQNVPEILLSFKGDVYQPEEENLGLARQTIKILKHYNLPFTILTKGGMRAVRDFDLLWGYERTSFGSTITFMNQELSNEWEPGAAKIYDRIKAIKLAHDNGIKTWISLEPVIDPNEALEVVKQLHLHVDYWKIGKLNYNNQIENSIDWSKFKGEIVGLLESFGSSYYLKNSLKNV